ncbi:MAG: tRNA (N6-threonylcarbamoyladenosine(37)-N6)-methyltransferase TrmO [Candidatus Jordarchaeaceae archaeon]
MNDEKYERAVFEPIGYVESSIDPEHNYDQREALARIIIKPELEEALEGIEDFSHIIVIFWTHKFSGMPFPLKVHPRRDPNLPLRGVLSTRSPIRPNCIGLTVVKLEKRENNVLEVRGLDAFNGTPVLDLKPYIKSSDCFPEAKAPEFLDRENQK